MKTAAVVTDTPDRLDYQKLHDAWELAHELCATVVVHSICLECPSVSYVPPTPRGQEGYVSNHHERWCPVLALHEGRQLTDRQRRQHRRYMDGPR